MADARRTKAKRRGAQVEPPNRFERTQREDDIEQLAHDEEGGLSSGAGIPACRRTGMSAAAVPTEFLSDNSKSILAENSSPDIPFRYSLNPYRGCEHGCAYCYARPYHEMLGLNAGLDFETKILVKHNAADLLRRELARNSWEPEPISMSGVTDCYQPVERRLRLTRACLEVLREARNPVVIVTKNALALRDLDLLEQMAAERLVHVGVSLTTLDEALAREMEPRTSRPAERLRAIRELSAAGVPVRAMVAPVIPGLTDSEIPSVLKAAKRAGAGAASYILLRLPLSVEPVFRDWLGRTHPLKQRRVESLLRSTRSGALSDAKFGTRMRGTGLLAEQIRDTFDVFARKYALDGKLPELDTSRFRPPRDPAGQLRMF